MKDMRRWLEGLYSQLRSKGLTDPDKRPEDVPCGTCESPISFRWKGEGQFNYWVKQGCLDCALAKKKARDEERRVKVLERAGVPPAFWGASLSDPHKIDSYNDAMAGVVANWTSPSWILAVGPVGTGKTSWITALFNTVILSDERWSSGLWTTEASMFERADVAHERGGYTARQASVAPYIRAPLLVLDDIGASRRHLTEWQGSVMRNLFDVRYSNGLPIFMTSNITTSSELTSRYGGHIYSRIMSATGGTTPLHGPDRRTNG